MAQKKSKSFRLNPTRVKGIPIQLFFFFSICCLSFTSLSAQSQVRVNKDGEIWQLQLDGEDFDVKGVTFGYHDDVKNYESHFNDLQFLGVNTIRTWGSNENTPKLLDAAQAHGIKVMVGIWMRHGRPGMEGDDSFNYLEDTAGMKVMYDQAIETVEAYKDHPAILTWGIGNEVFLNMATDPEKEAYAKFLESICSKVKEIDPNHPISSVEAWTFGLKWWEKYVPSLDIYGLNSYGPGAGYLESELKKRKIDKPYIVTEFGVTGEWDIKQKENDIVVEPDDQQKYDAIAKGYSEWIKSKASCLGVYVFHYGNGNNYGSAWLLTHHRNMLRPQYWAIREAFTGKKSINQVPKIKSFELPEEKFNSGTWVPVSIEVSDEEGEELAFSFYYNQRTGSRKRRDQLVALKHRGNREKGFEIQMPKENGAVKVYVNVNDTYKNVGIASTTIVVKDKEAKKNKFLVPKAHLPFYVYEDGEQMPYFPTAYMGNYQAMKVDHRYRDEAKKGEASIRISYDARDNWYGIGLVDPPDDWGEKLGGYQLTGAKTFSFWAKASKPNVKASIGFGLIGDDQPFPDTGKKSIETILDTRWKKYTLKIEDIDMSCIRSGLVVFSGGNGYPHEIFIDEVVFE